MGEQPRVPKLTWGDIGLMWSEFKPPAPTFTEKDLPTLDGKVVAISGGSGGVGYETVKMLATHTNAKIYSFVRRLDDTKKLFDELKKDINKPDAVIEPIYIDFNDMTTIKPAAEEFLSKTSRLDIMFHNAAVMNTPVEMRTKQGWNLDLQINAFGCFILQNLLNPIMSKTADISPANSVRIVWVGSVSLYFAPRTIINFDDPNYDKTKSVPNETYGQSKALEALFAVHWRTKYPEMEKVVSMYNCPGYLATDLSRYSGAWGSWFLKKVLNPQIYGAYTLIWCAFENHTTADSGKYVAPYGRFSRYKAELEIALHNEDGKKAWKFAEESVKDFL